MCIYVFVDIHGCVCVYVYGCVCMDNSDYLITRIQPSIDKLVSDCPIKFSAVSFIPVINGNWQWHLVCFS